MNIIGKNVRTFRQKQGWGQAEVANRLQISIPAFSKIETGITDINISRLNEIATLFNVHVLDILLEDNELSIEANFVELNKRKDELTEANQEIIRLQKRLIRLYDENRELSRCLKAVNYQSTTDHCMS
jgi:transcriptional regulator with XRE-family HTH domain